MIQGIFNEDDFRLHVFSKRHTGESISDLGKMIQVEIKKDFPKINKLSGAIPEHNKASQIYALRNGFKKKGIIPNYYFVKDGIEHHVILFEREI